MITEYYEIAIPQGPDVSPEITQAFTELHAHLIRISERLNTIELVEHAYGGFQNQAVVIAISAANVWAHITNATNDLWQGLEAYEITLSEDVMTINREGDYAGKLSMTFSALTGKDYQVRLYNITQQKQQGYVIGASATGAGNLTNVTLPLYIEANAGDKFQMEVTCNTDGTDPTFKSAVFYLAFLHD